MEIAVLYKRSYPVHPWRGAEAVSCNLLPLQPPSWQPEIIGYPCKQRTQISLAVSERLCDSRLEHDTLAMQRTAARLGYAQRVKPLVGKTRTCVEQRFKVPLVTPRPRAWPAGCTYLNRAAWEPSPSLIC